MRKKENRKPTENIIKGSIRKRQMFSVHREHRDMGQIPSLDLYCCFLNHSWSQINPHHLPVGSNGFRCWKEIGTSSSANIQHSCALRYCDPFYQVLPRVREDVGSNLTVGRSNAMIQICNLFFLRVTIAHREFLSSLMVCP